MNLTFPQTIVLKTLKQSLFHITKACKQARISRKTYYQWLKEVPEFKQAVDDLHEEYGDEIEQILKESAFNGDAKTAQFLAKTKFKNRGYVERSEVRHEGVDVISSDEVRNIEAHLSKVLHGSTGSVAKDKSA